eukprot:CAMPEP_0197433870 /NCGR_PEP_ID=MMETSP1175-20131217/1686_1 /TAXON_ID=1003142 /ORGANISM="Triceratium dubium, Strain CCMP147" /LENGTH=204 /DNA_ID=CAMNT_0042962395 /DNA_START=80 /DNA_END=694 /DNA_ORIENTATION=-
MKTPAAVVAALVSAFVFTAVSVAGTLAPEQDVIANKVYEITNGQSLSRSPLHGRREAVSEQCDQETTAILDNPNVVSAAKEVGKCPPPMEGNNFVYDYADCPAVPYFEANCTAAGGVNTNTDFVLSCRNSAGSPLNVNYTNIPLCVGASCDLNEVDEFIDQQFAALKRELEVLGANCGGSGAHTMNVRGFVLAFIAALSAFLYL